jgi:hypothetical protein
MAIYQRRKTAAILWPFLERLGRGSQDANRLWRANAVPKDYQVDAGLSRGSRGFGGVADSGKESSLAEGLTEELREGWAPGSAPVFEEFLIGKTQSFADVGPSKIEDAFQRNFRSVGGDGLVLAAKALPDAIVLVLGQASGLREIDAMDAGGIIAIRFPGGVEPIWRAVGNEIQERDQPRELPFQGKRAGDCEDGFDRG